jgi:hypothetical protein
VLRWLVSLCGVTSALVLVLVHAVVGFGATSQNGTVAGVQVDARGQRIAIDLSGQGSLVGVLPVAVRRRVVVSPDRRWRAVLALPGDVGNMGTVAIGRNVSGARAKVVERALLAGQAAVRWSPDSRWFAMVVWHPGETSAVAVSVDGQRRTLARRVCSADGQQDGLAWSPQGDRIALAVPGFRAPCSSGFGLLVRDVSSGHGRVVAQSIAGSPMWSPDGRWIATSGPSVEVMRSDGTQRRVIGGGGVVWAPQGSTLALVSRGRLLLGPPTALRPMDVGVAESPLPAFSADGRFVAYLRDSSLVVRRVTSHAVRLRVPFEHVQIAFLGWAGGKLLVDARVQGD